MIAVLYFTLDTLCQFVLIKISPYAHITTILKTIVGINFDSMGKKYEPMIIIVQRKMIKLILTLIFNITIPLVMSAKSLNLTVEQIHKLFHSGIFGSFFLLQIL